MKETAEEIDEKIIRATHGLVLPDLPELWRYRDLFFFLVWRDILVRYKQTALGVAWAVLQPLLTTFVFVIVFGKLGNFPLGSAPYPLVILAALLPWQFFATAANEGSLSLIASSNLISKVYFPRLLVPASAVLSGGLDFLVGIGLLFVGMLWYRVSWPPQIVLLPLFVALAAAAAFAVAAWFSALIVRFRDVKYIIPFITRIGLYVSPVGFLSSMIGEKFGPSVQRWYSLNPMVGVIDGFRWCILGSAFQPDWPGLALGTLLTVVALVSGVLYLRSTQRWFADVI